MTGTVATGCRIARPQRDGEGMQKSELTLLPALSQFSPCLARCKPEHQELGSVLLIEAGLLGHRAVGGREESGSGGRGDSTSTEHIVSSKQGAGGRDKGGSGEWAEVGGSGDV